MDEKWTAWGLLGLLFVLLLGRTEFTVLFNQQSGEFTSALAAHSSARFWHSMRVFGAALIAAVPIYGLFYYVRDRLGLAWRRWLTNHFLERYFRDRAYYQLTWNPSIDNPDQRIAEDINAFTQKSLRFLLEIVAAALQLVAFAGILWAISKTLVLFLVLYAFAGLAITFGIFGKPLVELNFQQLRREADFRFGLIRVRENAEAIAFYRGEERESEQVKHRFAYLYDNYKRLLRRTLDLNLFQYCYSFIALAIPSIIIAPRILSGELEVGRAIQAGGAFTAMLSALTVFIDNFEALSGFAAGIERLHSFSRILDPAKSGAKTNDVIEYVENFKLELDSVTVQTPNHERTLISNVSLAVEDKEGLLIVGASGGGKSSLLRTIAELWNTGNGIVRRPELKEMCFLPQRPYMILGTLREQLLYPKVKRDVSDDELQETLARANLPDIVARCGGFDTDLDFGKILSIGEQQRLAIARVLLAKPTYLILDEATSALDVENEEKLYLEMKESASTLISVAHHQTLLKYHKRVLRIAGDGGWTLDDATLIESIE
jgi:putative ATP-binding cassette transporter